MGNTIRFSRKSFNKGVNDTMTLRPLRSAMAPVIEKARSAVSGKTWIQTVRGAAINGEILPP